MCNCDCNERTDIVIRSLAEFDSLKKFFDSQVENGIFVEVKVEKPYYIGYGSLGKKHAWYATRWIVCKSCGCLWELNYPDFPAYGFVRKFRSKKDYVRES